MSCVSDLNSNPIFNYIIKTIKCGNLQTMNEVIIPEFSFLSILRPGEDLLYLYHYSKIEIKISIIKVFIPCFSITKDCLGYFFYISDFTQLFFRSSVNNDMVYQKCLIVIQYVNFRMKSSL